MINKLDNLVVKAIIRHVNKSPFVKYFNFTYKSQRYKLNEILPLILFVLRTGISWKHITTIHHNTVYKTFIRLTKCGLFKSTYIALLNQYIKRSPNKKLNIQCMDSSIIGNKYGCQDIGRNKYCRNKKVTKISFITDSKGIPINVKVNKGNSFDSEILCNQLNNNMVDEKVLTKNSKYILGDKGYCSTKLRTLLNNRGYETIIPFNKRNTKDKTKIKKLNTKQLNILKKRVVIEHTFGKLKKQFRRIDTRYDKMTSTYTEFLFFALIWLIKGTK